MQNLVSKNPVLRFKLGKKIEKFENPSGPIEKKSYKSNYDKNYVGGGLKIINWFSNLFNSPQLTTRVGMNGKPIVDTIQKNSSLTVQLQDVPVTGKIASNKSPLWDINYKIDNYISGFDAAQQGKNINSKSSLPRSFRAGYNTYYENPQPAPKLTITRPVNNYYLKGFENRKAELAQQGKTVRDIQKMLGFTGKDLDGKWGLNTENAYQQYLAMKNIPIYERTSEQTIDINSPSKVLNSTIINQEPITPELLIEQNMTNNNLQTAPNPFIPEQKVFTRNGSYNRSQIRDYMKLMGLNPYDFTGNLRKALRLWLNGLSDDNSLLTGELRNLFVTPYGYKQGGLLVSRNPIKRFKNRK